MNTYKRIYPEPKTPGQIKVLSTYVRTAKKWFKDLEQKIEQQKEPYVLFVMDKGTSFKISLLPGLALIFCNG